MSKARAQPNAPVADLVDLVVASLRREGPSSALRARGISKARLRELQQILLDGGQQRLSAALAAGSAGAPADDFAPCLWGLEARAERLRRLPNVVGVGVGRRRRRKRYGLEPVVTVFVSQKPDRESLEPDQRIPRRLRLRRKDGSLLWVPVDVVKSGELRLGDGGAPGAVPAPAQRPGPGDGIAQAGYVAPNFNTGTWGCLVRSVTGSSAGALCLLSAFHVLQPPGNEFEPFDVDQGSPTGVRIVTPSPEDAGGAAPADLGELLRGRRTPFADAAIARILEPSAIDQAIGGVAMAVGSREITPAEIGQTAVQFFGRSTPHKVGVVRHVPSMLATGGFTMQGLVLTDLISLPGDSGAIGLDLQFRVVGMLVGATNTHTAFMPFGPLAVTLGCELVTAS